MDLRKYGLKQPVEFRKPAIVLLQATVDLLIQLPAANRQGSSFSLEIVDLLLMALNAFNHRPAESQDEGIVMLSR